MFDWHAGLDSFREPAGCRIEVDGEEITHLYHLVSDVTVDIARSRAATATIVFVAPVDEAGGWAVQDGGEISAGASITIEAVFGTDSEEIMRGFILQVSPSYPADRGQTRVTVTCRDETLQLDQEHNRRMWGIPAPTTDGMIVTQIASENGLTPAPENDDGMSGLVLAQNGTDIDFLRQRADENGFELHTTAGFLYFGPMQLGLEPQAAIRIYAGRLTNCLNFDVSNDAHHADTITYDIAAQLGASVESETIAPDLEMLGLRPSNGEGTSAGASSWRLKRTTTPSAEEARAIALGHANNEAMRITATGELDGSLYGHVLTCGQPVGVDGAGEEFSGRYYVDQVKHTFTPDGYRQEFKLLRNALGNDLATAGGVLEAVLGG